MGIQLGLLAALGWGTADFIARGSTRSIGTMRTLFYVQFIGAISLAVYLLTSGELLRLSAEIEPQMWLLALLAALLAVGSSILLYRSFEVGIISIVSPIAASYAVITVILALFIGETLTTLRAIGVLAALSGVILASISKSESKGESRIRRWTIPPGVLLAIAAAIGYGITFWLIGFYVTPVFGGIVPVVVMRWTTIVVLLLGAIVTPMSLRPPRMNGWLPILVVGVLDTVGFVASNSGVLTEQVSIVAVLSSLFSAVTVVLASIFIREQLARTQWLGIAIIFGGVFLVSL
jgi:drug/metabolite transporter (DMT)-like permease